MWHCGCVNYFQQLLTDERFQSNMESEQQCYWLPMQILSTVQNVPSLPDVVQIGVMKVVLTVSSINCLYISKTLFLL